MTVEGCPNAVEVSVKCSDSTAEKRGAGSARQKRQHVLFKLPRSTQQLPGTRSES